MREKFADAKAEVEVARAALMTAENVNKLAHAEDHSGREKTTAVTAMMRTLTAHDVRAVMSGAASVLDINSVLDLALAPADPEERRRTAPRAPRPCSQVGYPSGGRLRVGRHHVQARLPSSHRPSRRRAASAGSLEIKHHRVVHFETRDNASERPYR